MPDIITTTELIDSATAERYLEHNVRNRLLTKRAVLAYLSDMKNGRWTFTGDPIKFDVDGNLLDGQHRLTAVALLNTTEGIKFSVVRNLPTEAQMVMDLGKRRTTGDQLGLKGIRCANHVAAVGRMYLLWQNGGLFGASNSSQITGRELQEWADLHPQATDSIADDMGMVNKLGALPRVAGAFMLRAREIDNAVADFYLEKLTTLANLDEGDPLLTLHRRLVRIRRDELDINPTAQLALFVQAWNKLRRGERISQYLRPTGGWNAVNFPIMDGDELATALERQ